MAAVKFEDNIREKLQDRELQPSENAWDRLESRLGADQKKRINRTRWFAIAASFIGILILASVFLNNDSVVQNKELVNEENPAVKRIEPVIEEQLEMIAPQEVEPEIALEETKTEEENTIKIAPVQGNKTANRTQEKRPVRDITESVIALNESGDETRKIDPVKNQPEIDDAKFVELKVEEVVADVKKMENMNLMATPEEIDALLVKAQREIGNRRILNSNTAKVDAAALLMDVEFELERSFRDKVFDALGEGYQKIRTAVVERNY